MVHSLKNLMTQVTYSQMMMEPHGQCLRVNLCYANIQGNHCHAKEKMPSINHGRQSVTPGRTDRTTRRAVEVIMVFTISITSGGTSSHSALARSIAMRQVSWRVAIQNILVRQCRRILFLKTCAYRDNPSVVLRTREEVQVA